MRHEAIEPSEIFTNREHPQARSNYRLEPWLRFLARFVDYSIWLLILGALRLWLGSHFPVSLFKYMIPFEFFTWIPVEAGLMSVWGTTPGKFFLKIHLQQGRKVKLDYSTALRRSFLVWFRGFGMGIPILNFICMLFAANKLRMQGKTSWDREENIMVHMRAVSRLRIILSSCFIFLCFVLYYSGRHEAIQANRGVENVR